jgi:DNA primase
MARMNSFEVITNSTGIETVPASHDLAQWHQAIGVARNVCARIFRDGGKPADAVKTFGLEPRHDVSIDWSRAVELVAEAMCAQSTKRAA